MLRRALLFFVDTYLLYFVISRTCQSRRKLLDATASFCLACAVMAGVAMFERTRNWLLYTDIMTRWQNFANAGFYLTRGGSVRAQVSAGHSIAMGNLLAVALGFWLHLKSQIASAKHRLGGTLLLCGGLYATNSRGAWLGAACVYFAFLAAGPRPVSRLMKGSIVVLALGCVILVSPIGGEILDMLPKAGQAADTYRERLAARGWDLVFAHPYFGDHFPWPEMEDLRQGEGIIDIVNTYLGVGLNYGLIGLFCFVSFMLFGMATVFARTKELARTDPDFSLFGTGIIACTVGILVMIDSNSFTLGVEKMFYILGGLATAYTRLTAPQRRAVAFNVRSTLSE